MVGVGLQGSGVTVVTVRGSRGQGDVCTSTVYTSYIYRRNSFWSRYGDVDSK